LLFDNIHETPTFVGRQNELGDLDEALTKLRIAELVGPEGTGKTALAKMYAQYRADRYGNRIILFRATSSDDIISYVRRLAGQLSTLEGPGLLIIDYAEFLQRSDLEVAVRNIESGPWLVHVLIVSRIPFKIATCITLKNLELEPFRHFISSSVGFDVGDQEVSQLWRDTKGSLRLVKTLLNAWSRDRSRPIGSLGKLFEPFDGPGILGPDGYPLQRHSSERRQIAERAQIVSGEMLRRLAVRPELVHELEPHQFEELAAELFEKKGFSVTLTPRTRDGGKDLYLAQSTELGSFRYAVECKRYRPDRPVSIDVIQRLAGVVDMERLTAGIVLTTSRFSRDAISHAAKLKYRMSLQGYAELKAMLEGFRPI
jgi:restriction system protein